MLPSNGNLSFDRFRAGLEHWSQRNSRIRMKTKHYFCVLRKNKQKNNPHFAPPFFMIIYTLVH